MTEGASPRSPAHDSAPGRQAASTAAAGLPLRLSTAAERLAHHRRTRVVHGEATPSRLTALAVLEAAGPLRISDLAARLGRRLLGLRVCLPEAGQGSSQLSA